MFHAFIKICPRTLHAIGDAVGDGLTEVFHFASCATRLALQSVARFASACRSQEQRGTGTDSQPQQQHTDAVCAPALLDHHHAFVIILISSRHANLLNGNDSRRSEGPLGEGSRSTASNLVTQIGIVGRRDELGLPIGCCATLHRRLHEA